MAEVGVLRDFTTYYRGYFLFPVTNCLYFSPLIDCFFLQKEGLSEHVQEGLHSGYFSSGHVLLAMWLFVVVMIIIDACYFCFPDDYSCTHLLFMRLLIIHVVYFCPHHYSCPYIFLMH